MRAITGEVCRPRKQGVQNTVAGEVSTVHCSPKLPIGTAAAGLTDRLPPIIRVNYYACLRFLPLMLHGTTTGGLYSTAVGTCLPASGSAAARTPTAA